MKISSSFLSRSVSVCEGAFLSRDLSLYFNASIDFKRFYYLFISLILSWIYSSFSWLLERETLHYCSFLRCFFLLCLFVRNLYSYIISVYSRLSFSCYPSSLLISIRFYSIFSRSFSIFTRSFASCLLLDPYSYALYLSYLVFTRWGLILNSIQFYSTFLRFTKETSSAISSSFSWLHPELMCSYRSLYFCLRAAATKLSCIVFYVMR